MVVVGSQRMVQYDDTAADEAVRVFDRGMEFEHAGELRRVPAHLPQRRHRRPAGRGRRAAEPRAADFAHAIRTGSEPRSNAQLGLEIVAAMEAAEESLRRNGEPIEIGERARAAA